MGDISRRLQQDELSPDDQKLILAHVCTRLDDIAIGYLRKLRMQAADVDDAKQNTVKRMLTKFLEWKAGKLRTSDDIDRLLILMLHAEYVREMRHRDSDHRKLQNYAAEAAAAELGSLLNSGESAPGLRSDVDPDDGETIEQIIRRLVDAGGGNDPELRMTVLLRLKQWNPAEISVAVMKRFPEKYQENPYSPATFHRRMKTIRKNLVRQPGSVTSP